MSGKQIKRTRKEAKVNLLEQIQLLENSCMMFDSGQVIEALNIATRLRVLLHDTHKSTSVLKQLDMKNKIYYFDTATPFNPANFGYGFHLLNTVVTPQYQGFRHRTEISEVTTPKKSFEEWWDKQIVLTNGRSFFGKGVNLTRSDIVMGLVNKDGGAHIDTKIPEDFYRMTRNNESGMFLNIFSQNSNTSETTCENVISDKLALYHSVRGIAFELLVSLKQFDNSLNMRTIKSKTHVTVTEK